MLTLSQNHRDCGLLSCIPHSPILFPTGTTPHPTRRAEEGVECSACLLPNPLSLSYVGLSHAERPLKEPTAPPVAITDPSGDGQKVAELLGPEPTGNKGKQRAWSFKAGVWGRLWGVAAGGGGQSLTTSPGQEKGYPVRSRVRSQRSWEAQRRAGWGRCSVSGRRLHFPAREGQRLPGLSKDEPPNPSMALWGQ